MHYHVPFRAEHRWIAERWCWIIDATSCKKEIEYYLHFLLTQHERVHRIRIARVRVDSRREIQMVSRQSMVMMVTRQSYCSRQIVISANKSHIYLDWKWIKYYTWITVMIGINNGGGQHRYARCGWYLVESDEENSAIKYANFDRTPPWWCWPQHLSPRSIRPIAISRLWRRLFDSWKEQQTLWQTTNIGWLTIPMIRAHHLLHSIETPYLW